MDANYFFRRDLHSLRQRQLLQLSKFIFLLSGITIVFSVADIEISHDRYLQSVTRKGKKAADTTPDHHHNITTWYEFFFTEEDFCEIHSDAVCFAYKIPITIFSILIIPLILKYYRVYCKNEINSRGIA